MRSEANANCIANLCRREDPCLRRNEQAICGAKRTQTALRIYADGRTRVYGGMSKQFAERSERKLHCEFNPRQAKRDPGTNKSNIEVIRSRVFPEFPLEVARDDSLPYNTNHTIAFLAYKLTNTHPHV